MKWLTARNRGLIIANNLRFVNRTDQMCALITVLDMTVHNLIGETHNDAKSVLAMGPRR